MKTGMYIDARHGMYPSQAWLLSRDETEHITVPPFSTLYGFVVSADTEQAAHIIEGPHETAMSKRLRSVGPGQYFCHATDDEPVTLTLDDDADAQVFAVIRHGFRGQGLVGGPIEASGRLFRFAPGLPATPWRPQPEPPVVSGGCAPVVSHPSFYPVGRGRTRYRLCLLC